MKSKIFFSIFLPFLLLLSLATSAWAVESLTKSEQKSFTLEVTGNLINLQAEQASFKDILYDLKEKTGIKVKIFDSVKDKKVSLNIKSLPIFAVHSLLEKMELSNFAVVYDGDLSSDVIYVLAEGQDISEVIKGKAIIRPASFTDGSTVSRIKGKDITTIHKGENKVPIRYVKDEVLLKFHLGVTDKEIEEVLKKHNLVLLDDKSLSKIGYIKVKITDGRDIIEVIKEVRKEYKIKIPEPNYIAGILTISDPLYENQWYIQDTNFDKAWDKAESEDKVKIAVLDTGIDSYHPDLSSKILRGYDFVNNNTYATDDHGHGTFVAGIISATANDIGIKGLNNYAEILPVKVINNSGIGTYEDTAKGIIYAADKGAKVINLSIGGYAFSFMLQDAVDYALEKGCIVVAAGGNDGIEQTIYPAAYPDVIGVSALGFNGQIWSDSNSGRHIDVSAPGVNILSTGLNNEYIYASGTSSSAAIVSALAGMLVSERPELSSSFIERLIMQSAMDLGDKGWDIIYGSGDINALASLEQEVEPFHDVAVRSVRIEPMVFEKEKPTYIVANIENRGTYKSEKIEVVFFRIVGEKKTEIGRQKAVTVIDKTTAIFEWKPENIKEKVKFRVSIVLEDDIDNSNNSKSTILFSMSETDGLYVLYAVERPVHQWIALQAYNKLPSGALKDDIIDYLPISSSSTYYSEDFPRFGWDNDINAYYSISTSLIEGAWEEDKGDRGSYSKYCNHFWDPDLGYNEGLHGASWMVGHCDNDGFIYDSSLAIAQEETFIKALNYYNGLNGYPVDKAAAYYWLGRTAHLLMDMSVPEHVLLDPHPLNQYLVGLIFGGYEYFTSYGSNIISTEQYKVITSTDAVIPNYSSYTYDSYTPSGYDDDLTKLFYKLADFTNNFDSDDRNGRTTDQNGVVTNITTYGNGKFRFGWNQLDAGKIVNRVELWDSTILGNPNYEVRDLIRYEDYDYYNNSCEDKIYYYEVFYNDVTSLAHLDDGVRVFYTDGTEDFFLVVQGNLLNDIENEPLECIYQPELESRAIGYVAALYQLFWDRTHLPPPGPDPTSLIVTATVTPNSNVAPYSVVNVNGTVRYNVDIDGDGQNDPIPTGTVTIDTGYDIYTVAVSDGNFNRNVHVTDYDRYININASSQTPDGSANLSGSTQEWVDIIGYGSGQNYTLDRTATCQNVGSQSQNYACLGETSWFKSDYPYVHAWVHLQDLYVPVRVKFEWYEPNGWFNHPQNPFITGWSDDPQDSEYLYWYDWYFTNNWILSGTNISDMEGQWQVKIYIDSGSGWIYRDTLTFYIRYDLTEHKTAKGVEGPPDFNPMNPTDIFTQTDSQVYTWMNLDNLAEDLDVKWEWYDPSGSLYYTGLAEPISQFDNSPGGFQPPFDWYRIQGNIILAGSSAENKTGNWEVKVSIRDPFGNYDPEYTDYFRIVESPAISPSVSVTTSPSLPIIETQTVTLNVSSSDNTYLEKVTLYWNDGSWHNQSWNTPYVNDYNPSHNIGSFSSGQVIEYYAVAWDTSDNSTESTHRTFTVQPETISTPDPPVGTEYIQTGQTKTYTTGNSTSSLGNPVEYQFDWGDGSPLVWSGTSQSHSWSSEGYYFIKTKARSQNNTNRESSWSNSLMVIVDSTNPDVVITTNGGNDFSTNQPTITIDGTASDPEPASGLSSVTINTGDSNNGTLLSWSFDVNLVPGNNPITVLATDNSGNVGSDIINITYISSSADLSITKTDSLDPVEVGNNLTYTIMITNNGPDDATNVVMTDTLPSGVIFVNANASQGSCNETSGTVSCNMGMIVNGGSANVDILVTPTAAGSLSNTASVTSDLADPDIVNNSASEITSTEFPSDGLYPCNILFDSANALGWFGGDDRGTTRNVGVGQSITLKRDCYINSIGFKFTGYFDYYQNSTGQGHDVTLVLNVRTSDGTIINTVEKVVPESFNGGWVNFNINQNLSAGIQYIFTSYLKDGETLKYEAGVLGNNQDMLPNSDGYTGQINVAGGDMEDWTIWSTHAWDFNLQMKGVLLIDLPQTGQTTCYDSAGNVINCSGTGQDGEMQAGVTWPEPRFIPGTGVEVDCVSDNLTGLIWARNANLPNSTRTWQEALDYVAFINSGNGLCGHSDWRLPNANEIESLINSEAPDSGSWLNGLNFINVQSDVYWSSTTSTYSTNYARSVNMWDGRKTAYLKSDVHYLWPVRSGQSGGVISISKTGQTSSYYQGDDGDLQMGISWPNPRFFDNGDGTVTDNLTGLIWLKDMNCLGNMIWQNALITIEDFNSIPSSYNCQELTSTYTDWRLPNIKEFMSLVDYSQSMPAFPPDHMFTNVQLNYYWSSTTHSFYTYGARWFHQSYGETGFTQKGAPRYVWPVRLGKIESFDYYCDDDIDGHISLSISNTCLGTSCIPVGCQTLPGDDCNDSDPDINPDTFWYADFDNDAYGDQASYIQQCNQPTDYVLDNTDNCSQTPNPGQQDTDWDGYGNMCDADLDNDGFVGPFDYTLFRAVWWSDTSSANWNADADFDSDGFIGPFDFTIFRNRWWTSEPWD